MEHHCFRICLLIAFITTAQNSPSVLAQEEIKPAGRRIVGGEKAYIKNHPWQVALNVKRNGKQYMCGGSLISQKWIITAAHCFSTKNDIEGIRAKTGTSDYSRGGNWLNIEQVILHENYDPSTYQNDIALLKLKKRSSGRIIPIASKRQKISVGQPLEVTGWGSTSEDGDASQHLLKAMVPYISNRTCNHESSYNGTITDEMLCAGKKDGGVDSCQGDSGGPLVLRNQNGPILVGAVSWGEGCARNLKYGVYTRVSSYHDWIVSILTKDAKRPID